MNLGYTAGADERGATLVEAAIIVPLFFLLVFGLLEFGFGFKDWLSLNHGAREAARVSVAAADDTRADILALRALEDGLVGNMLEAVSTVTIASADSPVDSSGVPVLGNIYTPVPGDACGWSPCPDPDIEPNWEASAAWPPSARQVVAPRSPGDPDVDRVQISVAFRHDYLTGFIGDSADWTATKIMRIEPQE